MIASTLILGSMIITTRFFLWSNSKIKPKKEIGFTPSELKSFQKYATWVVFPVVNKTLLLVSHFVWVKAVFTGLYSAYLSEWVFTFIHFLYFAFTVTTISRLSPEFLLKNTQRGIKSLELELFQSMLSRYNTYRDKGVVE